MVGGAMLWAAPTVQVWSASANADIASAPPTQVSPPGSGGSSPPPGGTDVEGTKTGSPALGGTEVEATKTGKPTPGVTDVEGTTTGTSASSLPRTGVAFPPAISAAAGAGLLAGGAAIRHWARDVADDDPTPDTAG